MGWGTLNEKQAECVAGLVRDRDVTDLGAGDLELARQLLWLGALTVRAIDKALPQTAPSYRLITLDREPFVTNPHSPDIAFVSWPTNQNGTGIVRLLERASMVILLGKCTDGTMCGGADLWDHVADREVLAYLPDRPNTLIVYGKGRVTRPLLPDEKAARSEEPIFWPPP